MKKQEKKINWNTSLRTEKNSITDSLQWKNHQLCDGWERFHILCHLFFSPPSGKLLTAVISESGPSHLQEMDSFLDAPVLVLQSSLTLLQRHAVHGLLNLKHAARSFNLRHLTRVSGADMKGASPGNEICLPGLDFNNSDRTIKTNNRLRCCFVWKLKRIQLVRCWAELQTNSEERASAVFMRSRRPP